MEWHLTVSTIDGGHNGGTTFVHRVAAEEGQAWKQRLEHAVSLAKDVERERLLWLEHGHSVRAMLRIKTAILYESTRFQVLCACLIVFGFILDLMEASIMPADNTDLYNFFFWMDIVLVKSSLQIAAAAASTPCAQRSSRGPRQRVASVQPVSQLAGERWAWLAALACPD